MDKNGNEDDLDFLEEEDELEAIPATKVTTGRGWSAEDDLLVLREEKHLPRLAEGEYTADVGEITAEKLQGPNGEWIKVTIPFRVKKPGGGDSVFVRFQASKSMNPKGRLYAIVQGILGKAPSDGFHLRLLENKRVKVQISHTEDAKGNVWEEVTSVRRLG